MSKRSSSDQKNKNRAEMELLDSKIEQNQVEYNQQTLLVVAAATSFVPAYYSHAINHVSWTSAANLPLYVLVPIVTAFMLAQAYAVMFTTEFLKRLKNYDETRNNESDARLLRHLRYHVALAYTIFFVNGVFLLLSTLLQGYFFRKTDPRAAFLLCPTVSAAVLWFIAQKNEESRKRKMGIRKTA